ncbi:MAG: T9SS type A sorting domain-containing protein [Bacteroidales bacterium]|nr:T9SS type A sorting domain-containing protein [Bacteroidales bacterium]
MKKVIITTIMGMLLACMAQAQPCSQIAQPTHVVGKRINADGEVTREFVSNFTYAEDGKLTRYRFPEYNIDGRFEYSGDTLTREYIVHGEGYHLQTESTRYTYENGRIKLIRICDLWDDCEQWQYTYDEYGRIALKQWKYDDHDDYHEHWTYEYENGGRTRIESYWTSWDLDGSWVLRQRKTNTYDEDYKTVTVLTENYSTDGELTSTKLITCHYTEDGRLLDNVHQTLVDGEWVNTAIVQIGYDEAGRRSEQLSGTWDAESGDWNFTKKDTYETSEDGLTYTVSFYKKSGDEWVWDKFNKQTVLFGSNLRLQQKMLNYMAWHELYGDAAVNQIEFTLEYTEEPTYMGADERQGLAISVFPNPGNNRMTVQAPIENAVVRIYDLQGKMVLARHFDFSTEIGTEGWPSGMYLWEIWDGNQKEASGKWIKE